MESPFIQVLIFIQDEFSDSSDFSSKIFVAFCRPERVVQPVNSLYTGTAQTAAQILKPVWRKLKLIL